MIITIANQKGGVGKTTTAVHLAQGLTLVANKTVLLIDLDPQGQCASALGKPQSSGVFNYLIACQRLESVCIQARRSLHLLPGDSQTAYVQLLWSAQNQPADYLKNILKQPGALWDHIVVDTSPSIGGLQERALYAADLVVIPTACDFLSASSVGETIRTLNAVQSSARVLVQPTFYDSVTRESGAIMAELNQLYPDNLLHPIHRDTLLRECSAEGVTIFEKRPLSRPAKQYAGLVRFIITPAYDDGLPKE